LENKRKGDVTAQKRTEAGSEKTEAEKRWWPKQSVARSLTGSRNFWTMMENRIFVSGEAERGRKDLNRFLEREMEGWKN
jgi:hypothetical protein